MRQKCEWCEEESENYLLMVKSLSFPFRTMLTKHLCARCASLLAETIEEVEDERKQSSNLCQSEY